MNQPVTWLYRALLAVLAPLVVCAALEAGLRLAGYGHPSGFLIPDPDAPGYLRTNPAFASLFLPDTFDLRPLNFRVAAAKPAGALRVVVLGESAAQGVPVPSFGFAPQLRAQLRALYPGRTIEVLDTGIVAVNSHVLYRIARDMTACHPDLYVVYAGNNEVVGPYGPGCAYLNRMPPLWVIRLSVALRGTRTGQWLGRLIGRFRGSGARKPEWGGMSMFVHDGVRGDDPRLQAVYANFRANLQGISDIARRAGVPVLFCTVVANWKDCAPFFSLHRADLPAGERAEWEKVFRPGVLAWRLGRREHARILLTQALRLDDQYADTWYLLGRIDLDEGRVSAARSELGAALHWDGLRFRPDGPINAAIRDVAKGRLVDLALLMGADPASTQPIAGRPWLFEHVHFDWPGNAFIARTLAARIAGRPAPLDDAACAAAVGYTAHERLGVLQEDDTIVRKPPFTQQLTYRQDQARLAREMAAARRAAEDPAELRRAEDSVDAARARDPGNSDLVGIAEGIEDDRGELPAALADARRLETLLPSEVGLVADEVGLLVRLQRLADARERLVGTADPEAELAPAWADYFIASRQWDDAGAYFSRQTRLHPDLAPLRVLWADVLAQDPDGHPEAFRQYEEGLQVEPGNAAALDGWVALLAGDHRESEAAALSLARAPDQPQNQANDLRAVKACESAGDQAGAARWMEAAETCGPVNATFELTLALKLFRLGRHDEMLERLAVAHRLSLDEGNPAVTAAIARLIARFGG